MAQSERDGEVYERAVWRTIAPLVPEGALTDDEAAVARTRAARARLGEGVPLGRGNFGEAFVVTDERGPLVVKLPASHNIHGRPWQDAEIRRAFQHEAGVANELRERGHRVVPDVVYTETDGGTPALVREYGDPAAVLSDREFERLEWALVAVEQDHFRVHDRLDLYRREDGSLFVADVGVWWPASEADPGAELPSYLAAESDLPMLLEEAAVRYIGPSMKGVITLPGMLEYVAALTTRAHRMATPHLQRWRSMAAARVDHRRTMGLRTLPELDALLG